MLVHSIYRLEKRDIERIPHDGPALLICNHVSFADPLIITAACRRPIRFVMDHHIFRWPVFSFVFRTARAIPIAPAKDDAALMEKAFDEVSAALRAGELVCIFPEGKLTADGEIGPFRPGIARILERDPVPVIPMALSGLWGSIFSRRDGRALARPWAARPFRPVAIAAGGPVAVVDAAPDTLRQQVLGLRGEHR
jgi:1-acyl-sn-glycerol-3-phosphate acyltransferase